MSEQKPIEHEADRDRYYIPLPGGWEIQTKGTGSTFRLYGPIGENGAMDHWPLTIDHWGQDYLERMARDIHATFADHAARVAELERLLDRAKQLLGETDIRADRAERRLVEARQRFSESLTEILLDCGDDESVDMPEFHRRVMAKYDEQEKPA